MKILITGAAGFIGFHLANKLLNEGHTVLGLDSINDYYDVNLKYARLKETGIDRTDIEFGKTATSTLNQNYRFLKLNIENRTGIEQLFAKEQFDYVCHLAAQAGVRYSLENPHAYIDSNITGFHNLIAASKDTVKHFVYASSSSVYGLNQEIPFSTSHGIAHPVSLYAATKKANELIAHTYSHLYGLPTTGLRFFTVYGPWGRPDMAYYMFTKSILEGKTISVNNMGKMKRDFTYIDDIVESISKIIFCPAKPDENWSALNPQPDSSSAPYRVYNIGNNKPVELMDFIETIEKKLGITAKKEFKPMPKADVVTTFADIDKLADEFDYCPDTPIEKGISEFVDWYKAFYSIK